MSQGIFLQIDQIGNAVSNFFSERPTASFEIKDLADKIVCKISKEGAKDQATLTMYIKKGGAVSHLVQCTPQRMDLKQLAEDCWTSVVSETSVSVSSCSCYTFRSISEEDYGTFTTIMKESLSYTPEEKEISSGAIKYSTKYTDKYGANVTANYYNNGTLTIQGALTPMLVYTWTNCVDLLGDLNPVEKEALITLSATSAPVRLSSDLKEHISNLAPIVGTKIEAFIITSITLANSGIVCEDNGWISFCILKGLDALLSRALTHDNPANAFANFSSHFDKDVTTGKHVLKSSNHDFDGNVPLKHALEAGYDLFYNERHSSFHIDRGNVETSTMLSYEKAVEVVEESLKVIDRICKHW